MEPSLHSRQPHAPTPANDAAAVLDRMQPQAIVTDVDGVLTDGAMYIGANGEELRRFSVRDGMGVRLLQDAGVGLAVLSAGKDTGLVRHRTSMLDIPANLVDVAPGDKGPRFEALCASLGVDQDRVVYIGDDANDTPAMDRAGATACPADAAGVIASRVDIVLPAPGGHGAFRAIVDLVLGARKRLST